jgi:hypothetical protein
VSFRIVIFTDQAIHRATAGVEVTEAGTLQSPRGVAVREDFFHHQFALAVGVDGVLSVTLGDGEFVRHAVSRAGG